MVNLSDNTKSSDLQKRWKAKERFLGELLRPNDSSTAEDIIQYKIELQQRLTYPLMSLVLVTIALAFILRGDLNRHGNSLNIVMAVLIGILFLGITIMIYRLLESSLSLIPLLYLHFIFFFGIALYMLKANSYKNEKSTAK